MTGLKRPLTNSLDLASGIPGPGRSWADIASPHRQTKLRSETLFGSLEVARLHEERFMTRRHTKVETLVWLLCYNQSRLHSTFNYVSPLQFEKRWQPDQARQTGPRSRLSDTKFTGKVSSTSFSEQATRSSRNDYTEITTKRREQTGARCDVSFLTDMP